MINRPSLTADGSKAIHILVVEDERIIAIHLKEILEALGYVVLAIAATAEEAFAKATELRPDLVLMDIRLQGEADGIWAAEQIWQSLQIPVIYVTGYSDPSTLERAKITAPFGYVLKPIQQRELHVAIETAMYRYEREQLLTTVLGSMGDGMIVVNTQGQVLFLNRSAELLTGWRQQEARNRPLTEVFNLVYEDTRQPVPNPAIAAIQQDRIIYLQERILLITKDGNSIPVVDSVAPLMNRKSFIIGAVLVFRDDTRRQLTEEHRLALLQNQPLETQTLGLQQLNQLKDDFLRMISHEMRTPLANIRMATQILEVILNQQRSLEAESNPALEQISRYLKILQEQCNQEIDIVNNVLDLQQLEAAIHPLEKTAINCYDWIPGTVSKFQDQAKSRQQHLQFDLAPDLPLLLSDQASLVRILTELLNNACKFTPPGGEIAVLAQIEASRSAAGAGEKNDGKKHEWRDAEIFSHPLLLQLIVSNSGVEIPPAELPRIFEKFYRLPSFDRWNQGGTGLGLALVKRLVIHLGALIQVESLDQQTRFIVELPVARNAETE